MMNKKQFQKSRKKGGFRGFSSFAKFSFAP